MKYLRPTLLSVLLLPGLAAPAQRDDARSVTEQYLFQAANAERTQRGLPALRWDEALHRAAAGHALEMARRGTISHRFPGEAELSVRGREAGAHFSLIAENVAEAPTAVTIHEAWMSSPGHRDNLLDPRVDAVAVSVISSGKQLYAVQDFGRTVAEMSFSDQEVTVGALLSAVRPMQLLDSGDARRTCEMDSGFAGTSRPLYVARFTSPDLKALPESLRSKIASGKFHQAAVGACAVRQPQSFTAYSIAVLLYP